MTITEIATKLNESSNRGFQLWKRKGILTSTWALYKKRGYFYYFDINENFIFDKNHRYSFEELIDEFKDGYYIIEDILE